MQQHTGQHVLSAAAIGSAMRARRVSTWALTRPPSISQLPSRPIRSAAAEAEANRIVWEDRPVVVRFASADEARQLPLRKESLREGTLRLVDVEGFDFRRAVARTSQDRWIGVIAVCGTERFKGGTRVEFVCGGRALTRFRQQRDVLAAGSGSCRSFPRNWRLPSSVFSQTTRHSARSRARCSLSWSYTRHER